jgi:hypothetical protein
VDASLFMQMLQPLLDLVSHTSPVEEKAKSGTQIVLAVYFMVSMW